MRKFLHSPGRPGDRRAGISALAALIRMPALAALVRTLALATLAGCAAVPAVAPATAPVPAAMQVQGVPPVPQALVDALARHADFAGHTLQDWHPTRRELLVTHRPAGGNVAQLYRVAGPLAPPEALTDGTEPVSQAWYAPGEGRPIVLARGTEGDEVYQLYRLDLPGRQQTLLTDPDQRHQLQAWLHRRPLALVASLPLDRTAAGGRRSEVNTGLWLLDASRPGQRQPLADLPGSGWRVGAVSRDDRQAALLRYRSAAESEVWLMDLASGQRHLLAPGAGAAPASLRPLAFSADGLALYLLSDAAAEVRELVRWDLASGAQTRLSAHLPWDVDDAGLSADGRLLALRVNVDGRDELHLLDAASGRPLALDGLPAGSVGRLMWHPQRPELAFSVAGARSPGQVHTLDASEGTNPSASLSSSTAAWTRPRLHPALDPAQLTEQQVVRWTSFDGRRISGLLNRPPARFSGPRPVLINIHGGPESQAKIGFAGRNNHLLQDLGIAILQPNVRGSSGYGKTFLTLDDGRRREDSVRDIGALLDWIATQPDLDPQRVVVAGGSYGGYMSLAVATTYPERIAGAIDVVGISNFVSFLENTESYRRDLRRVEYGDERDPAMRAFLQRISPLTQAGRIRRPLLVVQGRNDPRVPYTEAEQIVASVRANGSPVWYLRADNEGHGFARKENADYQFQATVLFLRQVLGLGPVP